jgi:DNA-binding transcriptional regulator YdaS (Cro superfamily)
MRNEMTLDALVTELTRNCGDELAACKTVGVSLLFVNQWRKDDAKVDAALTEAANVGTQGLVSAAIQRAVHGIQMDVYYKGEVVGQQTEYSDGLLTTLLKAKRPEFAVRRCGGRERTSERGQYHATCELVLGVAGDERSDDQSQTRFRRRRKRVIRTTGT